MKPSELREGVLELIEMHGNMTKETADDEFEEKTGIALLRLAAEGRGKDWMQLGEILNRLRLMDFTAPEVISMVVEAATGHPLYGEKKLKSMGWSEV